MESLLPVSEIEERAGKAHETINPFGFEGDSVHEPVEGVLVFAEALIAACKTVDKLSARRGHPDTLSEVIHRCVDVVVCYVLCTRLEPEEWFFH